MTAADIEYYIANSAYEVNDAINSKVSLWRGDITTLEIDAIVNAANSSLLGGGGGEKNVNPARAMFRLEMFLDFYPMSQKKTRHPTLTHMTLRNVD